MLSFITGTIVAGGVFWLAGGYILAMGLTGLFVLLAIWFIAVIAVTIFTGGA